MNDKAQIISLLSDEFDRWESLLASLNEEQVTAPLSPWEWSTKDVVAHLRAWQKISLSKMSGGLLLKVPAQPEWQLYTGLDENGDTDTINAWIHNKYRDQAWADVHGNWRADFQRLIELAELTPEKDLLDKEKYAWLDGYSLYDVLDGSYQHHHVDHFPAVIEWFQKQGVYANLSVSPSPMPKFD